MAVYLRWLYHHILSVVSYISQESWVFVSIVIVQSMMCVNDWMNCVLKAIFIHVHITLSHNHHYPDLSEGI